jgi:plastocyanin
MKTKALIFIFILSLFAAKVMGQCITVQPSATGQTQCIGGTFSAISVTSTATTFQWYSNTSASTSGGTSLGAANGAQTNSYTPQATVTGTLYYYCMVSGACGSETSTVSGAFIVNPATSIGSQSTATQTQCIGGTFTAITVTAGGTGTITYQWFSNTIASNSGGSNLGSSNGAQTNSYTPQSSSAGTLYYYCVVHSDCGSDVTSAVSGAFIVNPATSIGSQSTATQTQCIGGTFTAITVTASGGGTITYQWFSNTIASNSGGTNLGSSNGAQTNSYTPQASSAGTLYYYCIVHSDCGSDVTSAVSGAFIVNPATSIGSQSTATQTQCIGGTFTAITVTASGTGTITYQWFSNTIASNSGGSNLGSSNGAQTNSYTPQASSAGTLYYYCVVHSDCGSDVTSAVSGAFIVNPATFLSGQSTGAQAQCTGSAFTAITVTASGTGTLTYQWYKNTIASNSGGTSLGSSNGAQTFSYTPQSSVAGTLYYYCVIHSNCGTDVTSAISGAFVVYPVSNGGTLGSAQTICNNTTPAPITVTGYTGAIVRWEKSLSASFSSPVTIAVTTATLTLGVHTVDTWYRAVIQSGTCAEANSNVIKINVHLSLSSGISGGTTPICYNTSPGAITASATGGDGSYTWAWKSSATGSTVLGTNQIYTPGNLTATTDFWCDISSSCGPITTPIKTITVHPQLTLTGVSQNAQICSGSAAQINLNGLLSPSTSTIAYSINGAAQTPVTGIVSAGGNANFNTAVLAAVNNGKPLVITGITNEGTGCSATFANSTLLIVNSATTPTITESGAPCIGSAVTYTTEAGMTSYVWQITGGALGIDYTKSGGTATDNTITITWLTAMVHHVTVNYTNVNNCSVGSPTDKLVTVNALPAPTITSGPASVCIGSAGNAYVTQSGKLSYLWDVPTGGTITSGGSGNVIVVTWNTAGSHLVRVKYSSIEGCPAPAYTDYPVVVNPLPVPTFTGGPVTPRVTSTANVYSTQAGMSNYIWNVSGGGTITSGGTSGSSSATITWNSTGAQTVSVSYTNTSNCTAAAPAVYNVTVNPLPSVSNVQISGTPAIGYTLTGSYTYTDGGSGASISTFRWLRNGITAVGTLSSYVVQAADLNNTITFEVTPVTTVGPPNTGTPVTSSSTLPVENLSEIPVADQVCIEGVRSAGSILKGKYRYTHSKPEGASLCKWYIDGVYRAAGTTYTLLSTDINADQDITFEVTPVSSNIIPVTGTTAVSENPLAKVPLLPVEYSVAVTSVTLTATPSDGIFSGPGVTNGIFSPNSVGIGGPYPIQYQRIVINSSTTCSQKVIKNVDVVTNTTDFGSFNPVYCNDDAPDVITVTGVPFGAISLGFICTDPDAIVGATAWTVTIDPKKMNQGTNVDILYFRYRDFLGFISIISRPFVIDAVGTNLQIINLGAEYCEGTPKVNISVTGATPAGGTGAWTGTVLTDLTATTAAVNVALGTPGQTYPVTYQYTTPLGCKSAILPGSVKINPLPNPAFSLNPFYNLDGGSVDLVPVQSQGTFSGDGVSGTKLFPDIAGLGEHTINYYIKDAKNCVNTKDIKTIIKKAQGSFILSNGNTFPSVICYRDTTLTVSATGLPAGMTVNSFVNTRNSIVHTAGSTTATYNVPAAGEGLDTLIFSYKLDAVDYWISAIVNIDSLGLAEFVEFPGDKICDNIAPFKLNATPTGGVFSGPVAGNYLDPAQPAGPNAVTYKYTNQKTGCSISKTLPFTVIPAPQVSFAPKDVCIESAADTTFFANSTSSSDPVASWLWTFAEVGAAPETVKEPGYLYKTGGIHSVSLRAVTASGCIVTKTSSIDLGLQPRGNFTWKNDCYSPGAKLKLYDATVSELAITSQTWNFNNGSFISSDLNTEYLMPDTGTVNVKYIVRTNYANCADTVIRNIYLRPTVLIPADGFYKEDFESGKNGWGKDESDISNSWRFGTPDREVIKTASSGVAAWYTGYDISKQIRESSSVISPCFDFTNIQRPMIILNTFKRFDKNRDGAALQYRGETDTEWNYVGTEDDGIGWYNSTLITGKPGGDKTGWTSIGDQETKWNESRHTLDSLKGKKNVKFRVSYGSDGTSQNNDGIAFDDIWIGERTRKVLLEHFTNTNSKQSNDATAFVDKIISGKEKDIITVQYHTNFPDDDPFFTVNPGDASARIFSYGLSRVPYSLIDGGFSGNAYASLADYKNASLDTNDISRRSLMDSHFNLAVTPKINGEVLSVDCSVTASDVFSSDNLVLYLVVTEKKNSDQTGPLKDKVFLNVFRKFIPDAGGIELKKSWTKGETFSVPVQTWVVQNIKKPSDIEVIAFIQNSQTKEVYQAGSEVISTAKSSINISTPNAIETAPKVQPEVKEITFGMYPNPVISKLTIEFSSQLPADADIRIYDFQGAVKATYKVASGESEIVIEDISLKAGIYLIRISSGGIDLGHRKLIVSGE